jgi:nitrite reductase (NADH) large subunit
VFLQYYRENAGWLERTYDFVPRVGLEELHALLVDDRDGLVSGLEKRMQEAVDAHVDPWREGREPATTGQFADSLPLLPLPQVPVRDGSCSPAGTPPPTTSRGEPKTTSGVVG